MSGQPSHIGIGHIAHVLQVGDAHLAREEPGRHGIAEPREERDAVAELGLGLPRIGDVVDERGALLVGDLDESLAETRVGLGIEPSQAATHRHLAFGPVDHHEVDELGHAGVGGAARPLVLRDDDVGKQRHRRPLVRGEELRLVRALPAPGRAAWPSPGCWCACASAVASVRPMPAATGVAPMILRALRRVMSISSHLLSGSQSR